MMSMTMLVLLICIPQAPLENITILNDMFINFSVESLFGTEVFISLNNDFALAYIKPSKQL